MCCCVPLTVSRSVQLVAVDTEQSVRIQVFSHSVDCHFDLPRFMCTHTLACIYSQREREVKAQTYTRRVHGTSSFRHTDARVVCIFVTVLSLYRGPDRVSSFESTSVTTFRMISPSKYIKLNCLALFRRCGENQK